MYLAMPDSDYSDMNSLKIADYKLIFLFLSLGLCLFLPLQLAYGIQTDFDRVSINVNDEKS